LGTAFVAGLSVGIWENVEEISSSWSAERVFEPLLKDSETEQLISEWKEAVQRTLSGGGKK
jgi:glycerol kinase